MNKLKNSSGYLIPFCVITVLIVMFFCNDIKLSGGGVWTFYIGFTAIILAFAGILILFKRKKDSIKKQLQNERIKNFETRYIESCRKYADDENVKFDFPYIHLLLKDETIPLLPINTANTDQLLLLQKEHLQITCNLKTFRQHLAFLKASGKYSSNFYTAELPVKIGMGLWEFQKGKTPLIFPVFVRRQIIAGNIYVWNMETGMYESEMMNTEVKTLEGNFISRHENYCCSGIEFYKYPSCFY